jgi:cytochrome c-type biogenesis protein CcmH
MSRRTALLSAGCVLLSLIAAPIAAQNQTDAAVERGANRLFDEIMSPFCPGRTLATCPSPQAAEMRDDIKEQLRAGVTEEDIWESLYAIYGDQVRSVPRASGFNLLAWALPVLFFLLGAAVLIRRMRRTRRVESELAAEQTEGVDPELAARLDTELAELESLT